MKSEDPIRAWSDRFEAFQKERVGGSDSCDALRREAFEQFSEAGFPSTRQEAWRYTNVKRIQQLNYATGPANEITPDSSGFPDAEQIERLCVPLFACSLFVFVNGRFAPQLSTPENLRGGLQVQGLSQTLASADGAGIQRLGSQVDLKAHPFAALNTAFLEDGAVIHLPSNESVSQPIHVAFVSVASEQPRVSHPRVLVVAEAGSRASVIVDHVSIGDAERFTNSVIEVFAEANASLDLVLLQREADTDIHVSNLSVQVERDARVATHTLTLGGAIVRNDLYSTLVGNGAEITLNGLFLGTASRLVDNHTCVDHAVPHCQSRQLYKGILADESRGIFRGRVIVRPGAQKTDAWQSNPNLLLGAGAEVNTRPQLEIRANDVKCRHGTTVGRLDEEALFYLRSRGIGEDAARFLLTQGFAQEVTAALPLPALGEHVRELLLERLLGGAGERLGTGDER
ncbi:MAG: Fe-S cluster assembly protein SufD [Myxococcota bacterium]